MDDPQAQPLLSRRLRPAELMALDGLAGFLYTLVLVIAVVGPFSVPVWAAYVIPAAIGLPVVLRRRWPWPVFGVTLTASVLAMVLDVVREPFVAAAYTLLFAAMHTRRSRWEPTVAIAVLAAFGVLLLFVAGPGPPGAPWFRTALGGCVLLAVAWTVGRGVRERRAYAQRHAAQLSAQAATEERLRIARDLHDVVSHTLSMIGVKAGVARHVAGTHPAETQAALQVIEETSREALAEMRRMLGVLRTDMPPEAALAALPELAERAASAGVPVELQVTGVDGLPAEVAAAAYRIVQEAVTNVVRHAAPARCHVTVEGSAGSTGSAGGVRVVVTDDGAGSADPPEPGYGLIGMRERAARHGGTFTAGPRPGGGFAVSAWLPVTAPAAVAGTVAA